MKPNFKNLFISERLLRPALTHKSIMPSKLQAKISAALSSCRKHCQDERPPWLLKTRSSPTFITTVCSVATFTDGFIYGVASAKFAQDSVRETDVCP